MATARRFEFAFNEGDLGLFSEMHELGILPDGSGWVVLLGDVKMWGVDQVRSYVVEMQV